MNLKGQEAALALMQFARRESGMRLLLLPTAVLLPPLAVFLCRRAGTALWINLLLLGLGTLVFAFLFAGPGLAMVCASSLHALVHVIR